MKYYIIAGEASGDLHGAGLMRALRSCDPQAVFRFWGGEKMAAEGGTLAGDYREGAVMGVKEVLGRPADSCTGSQSARPTSQRGLPMRSS